MQTHKMHMPVNKIFYMSAWRQVDPTPSLFSFQFTKLKLPISSETEN